MGYLSNKDNIKAAFTTSNLSKDLFLNYTLNIFEASYANSKLSFQISKPLKLNTTESYYQNRYPANKIIIEDAHLNLSYVKEYLNNSFFSASLSTEIYSNKNDSTKSDSSILLKYVVSF